MEPSRKNHHHHNHHNHHHHQGQNNTNSNSVSNATVPATSTATTTPAVTTTTTTPAAPQSPQQQNKQQDVGTSAKKKKDRENRNSISQDLSYDWSQKGDGVSVSVVVGPNQDNRTVDIRTDETSLGLYLTDGRRFSTQLYADVVPGATSVVYKGPRCIVRLQKRDTNLHWPQLEAVKKLPPPTSAQDRILPTKTKSTSTSPGRTPEKKQPTITTTNSATNTTNTTTPSSPTTPAATPTTPTTTSTATSTDNNEEVIPVLNAKSDFVERDAENLLVVYLYVKGIKKDSAYVEFSEDAITARFSTCDGRFLQQYIGSNEDSVFEWHLNLKDKVVLEECKYKVMPNNIEMKLRKQANKKWGSLTAIPAESSPTGTIAKNTWVAASKMDSPTGIPPAPPVPPLLENKKPMCLVSPVSKGMRGITTGIPASSNSFSSTSSSSSLSSSSSYSSTYSASGCEGATGGSIVPRGTTGLDNIGNTCFMNSVLQCLINTQELKGYFLDYNYHEEINKDNPLGMGGKLAVSFAYLMKLLWSGSLPSHPPTKLKATMSLKANQFSGFAQHDAQEFMVELLDGLHEDLNRVKKKPYVAEPPDLDGCPDHKAAQESWKLHKMRNDSIIDDLFKGQFKSTLKCHECGKISVKFDEFCCLSVPIPKDQKVIPVVFFWKDPYQKPKKFFIRVPASATAEDLRHELCERTGVQACCIQIFERLKSKIHKIYEKGSSLSSGGPNDPLMAFEVYNPVKVGEPVVEVAVVQRMMIPCPPTRCAYCSRSAAPGSNLRRCTKCYRAGYCDQNCQRNHWHSHKVNCKLVPEQVGCPFILSLPESHATYSRLARVMEAYARYSVDIFQPPVYHSSSTSSHRSSTSSIDLSGEENDEMEVRSGDGDAVEDGETQERDETRDEPMTGDGSSQAESLGPWDNKEACAGAVCNDTSRGYDEPPQLSSSPSVRAVQPQRTMQLPSATQLFVIRPVNSRAQSLVPPAGEPLEDKGDEPLDLSDKRYLAMDWKTSEALRGHCLIQDKEVECEVEGSYSIQRNQPTTLEACIELFTQPENLSEGDSWRCPRCKKPVEATKQMCVWRLPHVLIIQLKRFSFKYVLCSDKIDKFVQYPVRGLNLQPYMSCKPEDGPAIYDLYGVINHMGRLLGGHYTSYARLFSKADTRQSELDWRLFDDSRVSFCSESRVVNEQAYLLLYRRRDTPFTLHRLPPPSPPMPPTVTQEENGMEHLEAEEATPMSISSASQQSSSSQPSSSSLEGEEQLSTTQEELD